MVFTGLVQCVGRALFCRQSNIILVKADASFWSSCKEGDSIAVNGCCLTLLAATTTCFAKFFIMQESRDKINMCTYLHSPPDNIMLDDIDVDSPLLLPVNLEKAMVLGDHYGGHMMSGHVDGMGRVFKIKPKQDGSHSVWIDMQSLNPTQRSKLSQWMVHKGSITIDGTSLTISKINWQTLMFRVSIITHTWNHTRMEFLQPSDLVNLEFDQWLKLKADTAEKKDDAYWMRLAIQQGELGRCTAPPNPWVGCVIVNPSNNECMGMGYHKRAGEAHAEVNAIRDAIDHGYESHLSGATCYTTLEPCCHTGRTGPCVDFLIQHKIKRVVIAIVDTDVKVSGRGVDRLTSAGVDVCVGVCHDEAYKSLRAYLHHRKHNVPWVVVKLASTIDGNVALTNGESKWITTEASRKDSHVRYRASSQVIVTSSGTLNTDYPTLNVRHWPAHLTTNEDRIQPHRVIIGNSIDFKAPLFNAIHDTQDGATDAGKIIIITSSESTYQQAIDRHIQAALIADSHNFKQVLLKIAELLPEAIQLLVESGPKLIGDIFARDLVQQVVLYQGLPIIGPFGKRWSVHDYTQGGTKSLPQLQAYFEKWHLEHSCIMGERDICTEYLIDVSDHFSS